MATMILRNLTSSLISSYHSRYSPLYWILFVSMNYHLVSTQHPVRVHILASPESVISPIILT